MRHPDRLFASETEGRGQEPTQIRADSSDVVIAEPNLAAIKNWESREGEVAWLERVEAKSTPLWTEGWYRNPTSGRSNNFGVYTDRPEKHFTVVVKGGCFPVSERCKEFLVNNSISVAEVYGGLSFDEAKREYGAAALIQKAFETLLNKRGNCPQPLDVHIVANIRDEQGIVELVEFFLGQAKSEGSKTSFTLDNFTKAAVKSGIDIFYPMSAKADEGVRKDPFRWLIKQYLEKNPQGVYRYVIDGPNTRLLDLMTLDLVERQKHFINANNATSVRDAVEKFAAKLGEFYGVLHRKNISYHLGSSEHCTLVDVTIAGVVMDIGGLTQDDSISKQSESYYAQAIKTTNLISYVCTEVLNADEAVLRSALSTFWDKYKGVYTDNNVESISSLPPSKAAKIRTQYLDVLAGDWIQLAPDLKHLASASQ